MPRQCANCKTETNRSRVTFDEHGKVKHEVCPHCDPASFEGPIEMPSDKKLWPGPAAMPNLYTRDSEGMYHAKDELIADTVDLWDKGETELKRDIKRRTRRTEPLTPDELAASIRWGEECLKPLIQRNR